jgi:hypothetical protein
VRGCIASPTGQNRYLPPILAIADEAFLPLIRITELSSSATPYLQPLPSAASRRSHGINRDINPLGSSCIPIVARRMSLLFVTPPRKLIALCLDWPAWTQPSPSVDAFDLRFLKTTACCKSASRRRESLASDSLASLIDQAVLVMDRVSGSILFY